MISRQKYIYILIPPNFLGYSNTFLQFYIFLPLFFRGIIIINTFFFIFEPQDDISIYQKIEEIEEKRIIELKKGNNYVIFYL